MPDVLDPPTRTAPSDDRSAELRTSRPRAHWHQRLIDAEQGFRFGLRSESTLYATFFAVAAVGATAVLFGVAAIEACLLIVALTQSVACTFMRLIVKETLGVDSTAHRLAAAAAVASALAGLLVAGLLLGPKLTGAW